MAVANPGKLAAKTIIATFCFNCGVLAIVSFLANQNWMSDLIGLFRSGIVAIGPFEHGRHHCCLCGMTRAFKSIWKGQFDLALQFNHNSIWLFSLMIMGCFIGVLLLIFSVSKSDTRQ